MTGNGPDLSDSPQHKTYYSRSLTYVFDYMYCQSYVEDPLMSPSPTIAGYALAATLLSPAFVAATAFSAGRHWPRPIGRIGVMAAGFGFLGTTVIAVLVGMGENVSVSIGALEWSADRLGVVLLLLVFGVSTVVHSTAGPAGSLASFTPGTSCSPIFTTAFTTGRLSGARTVTRVPDKASISPEASFLTVSGSPVYSG